MVGITADSVNAEVNVRAQEKQTTEYIASGAIVLVTKLHINHRAIVLDAELLEKD